MHDLIQEMGWEIVHQESIKDPGRRSRLWRPEEVHDVLKYNKGTDVVEGINLDLSKLTGDLYLSFDSLVKMTNMKFLNIYRVYRSNTCNVYLPNGLESLSYKLRYLHWDGFCLKSLPSNFCAEQLVELSMPDSKLKKLWDGVQNLVNLKTIDLSDSQDLIEVPDLAKAEKLERVDLSYCESLHQLHPSILSLPKLMRLYLSGCRMIESVNVRSKSLCVLELYRCSSLKEFSVTSEEMTELNLGDTPICALPSSIWHNRKLACLYLSGCSNLEFVGNNLSDDPDLFGCMQHNALFLQALPHYIGNLLSLKELDLCGTNVESLPASIKNLSMLRKLKLDNCMKLVSLPELPPSLEQLWARNCTYLDTDFTQWLVLQHTFQSRIPYFIPYLHKHPPTYRDEEYFFFPGDHVTNECGFHAGESSITIPYLPQSDLCGFIYCFILSKGSSPNAWASYSIYQDGTEVGRGGKSIHCPKLISDHVLFLYHNVCQFYTMSEMYDHFSNIPFKFEFNYCVSMDEHDQVRIKGCGVFPVYATSSGWKLVSSSSKEIFESESITQISENESQTRSIGVGVRGSNDETEDDWEELPATKRGRTSP